MSDQQSGIEAVIEEMKALYQPRIETVGATDDGEDINVLIRPQNMHAEPVENYLSQFRANPRRRKGQSSHVTLASLIAFTKRFKDADSVLFANGSRTSPQLLTVFDYNEAVSGESDLGIIAKPRFGEHRAVYTFPLSDEWSAWMGGNGKHMDQQEFAEFLENRILDILPPLTEFDEGTEAIEEMMTSLGGTMATAAQLMELSRGLAVHVDERVKNTVNLSTGEVEVQYAAADNGTDGAPLKVPSMFLIGIPVFRLGAIYRIPVRLRYRARGGAIAWFYELYRTDRVFENAYDEACHLAAEETGLPIFNGTPES